MRRLCQSEHQRLVVAAEENEALPREVFARWGELGLLGVRYPDSDGGSGLDKVSDCIVREELSYMSQGFASSWSAHSHLGIWPIWKAGTESQRERFFRPAVAGRKIAGFALSEPDGGSNIRGLKTRAERVAGGWNPCRIARSSMSSMTTSKCDSHWRFCSVRRVWRYECTNRRWPF